MEIGSVIYWSTSKITKTSIFCIGEREEQSVGDALTDHNPSDHLTIQLRLYILLAQNYIKLEQGSEIK